MLPSGTLDSFLGATSDAFCCPLAVFIQIQGCVICLTLALGWTLAACVRYGYGYRYWYGYGPFSKNVGDHIHVYPDMFLSFSRNRMIARIKDRIRIGNSFAFLCDDINDLDHYNQINLPRVSVVMPLKGFGEHNLKNWRTQITSLYGGPLEFLFVVESTDDPAYHAVSFLISDFKVGVERMHKDSKYVLFLDDDVRLHPGTIGALTAEMEKNPKVFIQTGYPLDLPSGSLGSYCIYEYHMPCSMGFATGGRTFFLWGGCMMMHADDFRNDHYGVVTSLRDGGYSDDMTLAAVAGAYKQLITSPSVAVFPHPLASDLSFARYWNYLRKQTFVLESYVTWVNWIMNKALFVVHCYLSWCFVMPYFMAAIHVAAAVRVGHYDSLRKETSYNFGGYLSLLALFC
ncbi:hypothetical protein EJ110_NYTH00450 [Nymphaea thermarum]|nr:hypothetical protein EJ110_NYTH00450 [Nymphaea thermarum]